MCQNPLAQSSATIERDHFRFIFLALPLTSPQPSPLSPPLIRPLSVSSSSSALLKWREKHREKGVTFDRSCSSCGMYGCVLICIGFRNYREESQRVAAAFKSHTIFFWGKTRKFQMHVDLLRSHKLWRFVSRMGWGVVTCICVQDSMIPYVIFYHVNFRCVCVSEYVCVFERNRVKMCVFVLHCIVYYV